MTAARPDDRALMELADLVALAAESDAAGAAAARDRLAGRYPQLLAAFDRALSGAGQNSPLDRPVFRSDPEPVSSWASGTRIGPWRIEAMAGRGGMGEVYRAVRADGAFERTVAIKRMSLDRKGFEARFRSERNLLARLDHPAIARLLDGGLDAAGGPYLVMEWVDGKDLGAWLDRTVTLPMRLDLLEQLGEAIAAAHRSLVVHRDLKPSNVRVGPDGRPKLLDFGIAKLIDSEQPDATATFGPFTPQYAAPEQLLGQPVSTQTDVHGFGLLIYEVLAGQPAFPLANRSVADAVRAICDQEAPTLSEHAAQQSLPYPRQRLRGDLDAIVRRCLAKQPAQRYESMSELLADLRRHRAHLPVHARDGQWRYRTGRWMRRHWLAVSLATLSFVALIAGASGVLWQAQVAARERDQARSEARLQEALREHFLLVLREAASGQNGDLRQVLDQSVLGIDQLYRDAPELRRDLMLALGELYFHVGDYLASRKLLESLAAQTDLLASPLHRARTYYQLALAQTRLGDLDAAEHSLQAAKAELSLLPAARALSAEIGMADAQLLRARGDFAGGLALQLQSVERMRAAPEATARALGIAESNLAMGYMQSGDLVAAERENRRALATWEHAGLAMNSNLPVVLSNLGHIAAMQGRPRAALAHYDSALAATAGATAQMPSHAALLNARARILMILARESEAAPLALAAEDILRARTGDESPDRLGVLGTRIDCAIQSGKFAEAGALAVTASSIAQQRLAAGHPLRLRVELSMARLLQLQEGDARALPEFRRIAAALAGAPATLRSVQVRAELWSAEAALALGEDLESIAALARANAALDGLQGAAGMERLDVASLLALVERDSKGFERAQALLASELGADHPRLIWFRQQWAGRAAG